MTDSQNNEQHFTHAAAELGEKQAVIAHCAIFNENGIKIVEKGAAINLGLYERMMQHKLQAPIEACVSSSNTVSGKTLKASAEKILDEVPFFTRMAPDAPSRALLLDAFETMPLPAPIAFQLTIAHDVRPEIYGQLIRTALTAAWLSKTPLLSRFDVTMACTAGMLHDIGMLHVDPLLLQPEHTLNAAQQRQLYSHPLISTMLSERHHQYPKEVIRAVREHHECLDGSGYPRLLVGDAISPLGKLLSLAKVVAAMFAPERDAPELRLSVLLRMNTHRYDDTLSQQVIGLLQAQSDSQIASLAHLADPLEALKGINDMLQSWPAELSKSKAINTSRGAELDLLTGQVGQVHRALAKVGATSSQLAYLGNEALDKSLLNEMTLITREAGWQLRSVLRQIRSRWPLTPGEAYPAVLHSWLDDAEAVVVQIGGFETSDQVDEQEEAQA